VLLGLRTRAEERRSLGFLFDDVLPSPLDSLHFVWTKNQLFYIFVYTALFLELCLDEKNEKMIEQVPLVLCTQYAYPYLVPYIGKKVCLGLNFERPSLLERRVILYIV